MVQLVFVHGVATRISREYSREVETRDTLFRNVVFEGKGVELHSPIWGDLVPHIDPAVFATDAKVASFNIGRVGEHQSPNAADGGVGASEAGASVSVSTLVARVNAIAILDAFLSEIVEESERKNRALTHEELQAFRQVVDAMSRGNANDLLKGAVSADDIARRLSAASYGLSDFVGSAVTKVVERVRNTVSTVGYAAIRSTLNPIIGLFIGDVFSYLKEGSVRDQIRAKVAETLTIAHSQCLAGGGPLIAVGHSLGGVVLVDMLQDLNRAGLPPDMSVVQLVTVGSQPGLFQALQLMSASAAPNGKATKPACVRNWLNVFDPIDPLAFRASATFEDVNDVAFDSVTGLFSSHTTYFKRPQFYARLKKRLQDEKVISE